MKRAVVILVLGARLAAADGVSLRPTRGTLAPMQVPGSFILTGEAAPGRFSNGEAVTHAAVKLPYRIDLTWRRLGPEAGRSMHITVAGGVLLIKSGKISLYQFDEAKFSADGWTPLPGYDAHAQHDISVRQDSKELVIEIDHHRAVRFALPTSRVDVHPGVGMKGAPGHRTAIYVRAFSVTAL